MQSPTPALHILFQNLSILPSPSKMVQILRLFIIIDTLNTPSAIPITTCLWITISITCTSRVHGTPCKLLVIFLLGQAFDRRTVHRPTRCIRVQIRCATNWLGFLGSAVVIALGILIKTLGFSGEFRGSGWVGNCWQAILSKTDGGLTFRCRILRVILCVISEAILKSWWSACA